MELWKSWSLFHSIAMWVSQLAVLLQSLWICTVYGFEGLDGGDDLFKFVTVSSIISFFFFFLVFEIASLHYISGLTL